MLSNFKDVTFNVKLASELLGVSRTSLYNFEKENIVQPRKALRGATSRKEYSWEDVIAISTHLKSKKSDSCAKNTKKISVFSNLKGGVGKSLISQNISMSASVDKKVLLIDIDPQGHNSLCFGVYDEDKKTILDCMANEKLPLEDVVEEITENFHIVPANLSLTTADFVLQSDLKRAERLKPILEKALDTYDEIIIDTNPSASILNINSFLSATHINIVCATDYLSVAGLNQMFSVLDDLAEDFSIDPTIRVIPNLFNLREKISQESLGYLRKDFSEYLTDVVIRHNTDLKQSQKLGVPIWSYKPKSNGAEDIKALSKELNL
jgi:chromosome partitioning protein